jgi:hypothetical protein
VHPIMHPHEIRLSHASQDYLPVRNSVPRDAPLVSVSADSACRGARRPLVGTSRCFVPPSRPALFVSDTLKCRGSLCHVVRGCDPDVIQCSLTNLIHDVFTVWESLDIRAEGGHGGGGDSGGCDGGAGDDGGAGGAAGG